MPDASIGIFDSGVGGLTVARAIIDQLPHESITYVADTARQPYGPKRIAELRAYALEVMDHLVEQNVKMLVIACNSASAAVLRDARERYDVPVVEVIMPATRRAVRATRNGKVGVIATRATIESMAYHDAFTAAPRRAAHRRGRPTPGRVRRARRDDERRADRGRTRLPGARQGRRLRHAHPRLHPLPAARRRDLLRRRRGGHAHLQRRRDGQGRLSDPARPRTGGRRRGHPRHRFRATGDSLLFARLGRRFLGPEIDAVEVAPVGGYYL
ncbi:glutamate racemase [Nonomuraea salmonea]|uniref:glutamate racemase n=1 Tax=Nonomuraea salmonea TaxID=46181 RepID=UPI0031EACA30